MAKDQDTRTPEEIEAYAKECRRVAADTRKQAEAALKTAEEWDALAGESAKLASQRRGRSIPDTPRKAAPKKSKR